MNDRAISRVAAAMLAFHAAAALAQGAVYESRDKAGPVFSDRPSPGATVVDLPPPNVVSSPAPPPAPAPAASAPAYRTLSIVSPANGGTIHTNTGEFDLTVRSAPALRASDSFRVRLDGQLLPTSYRSTRLHINAADWQAAAGEDTEHTLQVAIVEARSGVLIESAPLRFYAHRATVGGQRR